LMWYKLGLWATCKYWLLPLLVAHVNAGSLLDSDSATSFLFPNLKNSGVKQIPFYSLGVSCVDGSSNVNINR
jgi:hypothetical protein